MVQEETVERGGMGGWKQKALFGELIDGAEDKSEQLSIGHATKIERAMVRFGHRRGRQGIQKTKGLVPRGAKHKRKGLN